MEVKTAKEIKTSRVTGVSMVGEPYQTRQVYQVSLANGEVVKFFSAPNGVGKPWVRNVGDDIQYYINNEKNQTARLHNPNWEERKPMPVGTTQPTQTNRPMSDRVTDRERQVSIERQCSMKSAVELNASNGNIDNVLRDAEILLNWIQNR